MKIRKTYLARTASQLIAESHPVLMQAGNSELVHPALAGHVLAVDHDINALAIRNSGGLVALIRLS
jgi:hypothetical protein